MAAFGALVLAGAQVVAAVGAEVCTASLLPHSHTVNARANPGSSGQFAKGDQVSAGSFATSSVGSATPFSIMPPFMKVRYIIKHTNG